MNLKVWNNTSRAFGVAGIIIPAGQGRFVRNVEGEDLALLKKRVESGEAGAPGLESKPKRTRKTRSKAKSKPKPQAEAESPTLTLSDGEAGESDAAPDEAKE